jgi:hypothetical protein
MGGCIGMMENVKIKKLKNVSFLGGASKKHMKCKNCAFYHQVEDWYYDECMQGPMTTLPNDPACPMFERKKGGVA